VSKEIIAAPILPRRRKHFVHGFLVSPAPCSLDGSPDISPRRYFLVHGARFGKIRGDDVKRKQQEHNNVSNVELRNVVRPAI
jgi:hypothetical protein